MTPTTKKLLTPYDPSNPVWQSKDFLIPELVDEIPRLVGISGRQVATHGLVVYVGKEITANDLFARMVDSGRTFTSVSRAHESLESFVQDVSAFKIGDIVEITTDCSPRGYALTKSEHRAPPAGAKKGLP